jgi:CheY-like chemotaxis protein
VALSLLIQTHKRDTMMSTLLVIDDDRLHCDLLQMALARHGYQVSIATGGREGVALFRQLRPLVTLLDLRMPENGWSGGAQGNSNP